MAAALLGRLLSSLPAPRNVLRCGATCTVEKWFSKHISSDSRPKQPLTAYLRFCKDKQPIFRKQNPDVNILDITKKLAHCWRELPASEKQSYEAAAKVERQVYKEEMAKFKAQLTPAQEEALKEEKRRKMAKRRATRKKRQLTVLGKPKRPRSAFNIFVSEHFQEAKGVSIQGKMKNLFEQWQKMTSSEKKTYQQLAEDDKIRYENEMKSWEDHMKEIGREDLVRYKNRRKTSKGKKTTKGKKTKGKKTTKLTSKKKGAVVKKSSGSKVATPAIKEKRVKAKQSEE